MKYTKTLVSAIIKAIEKCPFQTWLNVQVVDRADYADYAVIAFENADGVQHKFVIAGNTVSVIYRSNCRGAKWICDFHLPNLTRDSLMLGLGASLFRLHEMDGYLEGGEN